MTGNGVATVARPRPSAVRRSWSWLAPLIVIGLIVAVAVLAPVIAPYDPLQQDLLAMLQAPSSAHWLGTDALGRDVLSRALHGGRPPLLIATVSVALGAIVGVVLGLVSGYAGGAVDAVLGRVADIQLSIPGLVLSLIVLALFGTSIENVVLVLVLQSWTLYYRVVRPRAMSIRRAAFIESALLSRLGGVRILWRHVLPNVSSALVITMTLNFTGVVLAESSLSFLGMGIQPPTPSWGVMIGEGQSYLASAWWVTLGPGVFIVALILSLQIVGDRLSERLALRSLLDGKEG